MFGVVSLTMGNSIFPSGHRSVRYLNYFSKLFLRKLFFLSKFLKKHSYFFLIHFVIVPPLVSLYKMSQQINTTQSEKCPVFLPDIPCLLLKFNFIQLDKLIFIFSLWLYEVTSILSKIQQESHKYS